MEKVAGENSSPVIQNDRMVSQSQLLEALIQAANAWKRLVDRELYRPADLLNTSVAAYKTLLLAELLEKDEVVTHEFGNRLMDSNQGRCNVENFEKACAEVDHFLHLPKITIEA